MKLQPTDLRVKRESGIALVLVMFTVAAAVILALAFISTTSIGSSSAQAAEDYYRARHIAESGLSMLARYTDENPMWRDFRTNGTWVNKQAVDGGTFSANASFTTNLREPLYLTVTSTYGSASHKVRGRLMTVGHVWGSAVKEGIALRNQSWIDAYDSSIGPYGITNASSDVAVTTNATYAGAVTVTNFSEIRGSVWIGAGANPSTVVSKDSTAIITGAVDDLPANLTFPTPPAMPTNTGSNLGSRTFSSGTTIINSNRQYDDLVVEVDATLRITGNVTIRVNKALTIRGQSIITVDPGSKLTLYVQEAITISNYAQVNHTGDTTRLVIHGLGTGYTHIIQDQVHVCAAIIAPNSSLTVQNRANFYGVFVGKSLIVQDRGYMHVDRNPALLDSDLRLPVFPTGTQLRQVVEQ